MKINFDKLYLSCFLCLIFLQSFAQIPYQHTSDTTSGNSLNSCIVEWSKAGVEGGIPTPNIYKNKKEIAPKDNLQEVINELAAVGGGVLILKPGHYVIRSAIQMKSHVILRGTSKDSVILSVKMHGYHFSTGLPRLCAIKIDNLQYTGIENITMKYDDASFEPVDKDSINAPWNETVFDVRETRDTTLFVEHIWINKSQNCWVKNCNLLWAGNDPILITNSKHITCCENYIDRSYNKSDGGMGYYDITNSSYVRISNETIRRIRHLSIQKGSEYNVLINNNLEVDINFHDGDKGNNLVANNTIRIPKWHSWHCFQRGDPGQHKVPGEGNVLFNNDAVYKTGKKEFSENGQIYHINTKWEGKRVIAVQYLPSEINNLYRFINANLTK